MKEKKHIEIVITNTVGLELMSNSTVTAVKQALEENYEYVSVTMIENQQDLHELILRKPDLVFSGVKYLGFNEQSKKRSSQNKLWLSSVLKKNGINHTGSETQALKLEINKVKAKEVLQTQNIPTSEFFTASPGEFTHKGTLPIEFPLFMKPIYEGAGKGIDEDSVIRNFQEFDQKAKQLRNSGHSIVLVEKYLSGREFTIGILQDAQTKQLKAFPVELVPQKNTKGDAFLCHKAKQEDQESVIPITDKKIFDEVVAFAKKSFKALGARDYGRIDLRMDHNNTLHFLEANLVPGMGGGYFSRAIKMAENTSHAQMINRIAALALSRSENGITHTKKSVIAD